MHPANRSRGKRTSLMGAPGKDLQFSLIGLMVICPSLNQSCGQEKEGSDWPDLRIRKTGFAPHSLKVELRAVRAGS